MYNSDDNYDEDEKKSQNPNYHQTKMIKFNNTINI